MNNTPYRTLIIDDEPPARQRLQELLSSFTDTFTVIGEAVDGFDGLKKIASLKPDVIFLDIQMPGMTGFEMLQQLQNIPIIIFCTAHDVFSLQAFETNSLDYLLKPVKKERLTKTKEKLKFFKKKDQTEQLANLMQQIGALTNQRNKPTSITVQNGKKIIFIKLEDIAYLKASDKYVSLFVKNGDEHIMNRTVAQLEEELPSYFLRIHRSTIINTSMIKEMQTYFNSRYVLTLNDRPQTRIISGRSYQLELKALMGI